MILPVIGWLISVSIMLNTGPCPGVIGVMYNQEGIVRDVFSNSPADEAGIQLGDKILDRRSTRGKPGTIADVRLIRNGVLLSTSVVRICVDDLQRGGW